MHSADFATAPPAAEHPHVIRCAYAPGPDRFGDLHLAADRQRGTIVLIHGGFWRPHRGLEMTTPAARTLSEAGWNVWNIEYRRPAAIAWRDTLSDCEDAVGHVQSLTHHFGLAYGPTILVGHSAGGHLAAWLAGRPVAAAFDGLVTLNGVLDFALAFQRKTGDGAPQEFVGADAGIDVLNECQPAATLPMPATCLHSPDDERVPFEITSSYVTAAQAVGSVVDLVRIPGHHTGPIEPDGPIWPTVREAIDAIAATTR